MIDFEVIKIGNDHLAAIHIFINMRQSFKANAFHPSGFSRYFSILRIFDHDTTIRLYGELLTCEQEDLRIRF